LNVVGVMSGMYRAIAIVVVGALAPVGCTVTDRMQDASSSPPPSGPVAASLTSSGAGEVRYTCDTPPGFPLSVFDQPAVAEVAADPSAAALRTAFGAELAHGFPRSSYWLVGRGPTHANFVARSEAGEAPFVYASFEQRDGAWTLSGYGDCRPTVVLEGLSPASWTFDPALPAPDDAATSFTAVVTEWACTGGRPIADRLLPPMITYGADSISVIFSARPLPGEHDCPGNPSSRVLVELREPLGSRRLVDGAVFPPADPSAPAP
jgi:hypothetical protein